MRYNGKIMLALNDPTLIVTEKLDAEGNCRVIADVLSANLTDEQLQTAKENASHMVQAWNHHDRLVEVLTGLSKAYLAMERMLNDERSLSNKEPMMVSQGEGTWYSHAAHILGQIEFEKK